MKELGKPNQLPKEVQMIIKGYQMNYNVFDVEEITAVESHVPAVWA
jgi:hypothetical protein